MPNRNELIESFHKNVNTANSELAKKEHLKNLLLRLFDQDNNSSEVIDQMAMGSEKTIFNIPLKERIKTGRADTQYGKVIIEFESDLSKTREHAKEQLAEYVSGNWKSGNEYNFTLISTDCVKWEIYAPKYENLVEDDTFVAEDIELLQVDGFNLNKDNSSDFFFFLDRYLFRTELIKPTLEQIKIDFGPSSSTFISCIDELTKYFGKVKANNDVKIAFEQWQKFLSIAYGSFEAREDAFLVHTYLSVFAKILAYEVITGDDFIDEDELKGIIRGSIFDKLHVKNFIDQDFYNWISHEEHFQKLKPVFRKITQQVGNYNFENVDEDILKGVYQELIDIDTRHSLGEYYTPDWLCEKVVNNLDFKKDSQILDPACGSGSFLKASIDRLKNDFPELSARDLSEKVVGIDIHPLSVQIAKTTVLLSLGKKIERAKKPINLRVYLANTLLTPKGSVGLFGSRYKMSIDKSNYDISTKVFEDPGLFDAGITVAEELADLSKETEEESIKTFEQVLKRRYSKGGLTDDLIDSFYKIYIGFRKAKKEGRDSIWRFITQNLYKPFFLKENFDFIVGNPPWLTFRQVNSGIYQDQLRTLATQLKVTPEKQSDLTHLEIAAIFLAHCSSYFLKKDHEIAFVLPRSFFSASHHDNSRSGKALGFKVTELWDLDGVSPLFKVPSCVIFGKKKHALKKPPKSGIKGFKVSGNLKNQSLNLENAKSDLNFKKTKWYYGKLGKLTAYTEYKLNKSNQVNYYQPEFRQGATIVPRNFYFVEPVNGTPQDFDNREIVIENPEDIKKKARDPWRDFKPSDSINSNFLFKTILAKSLVPFALINPELVILPVQVEKGEEKKEINLLSWEDIKDDGYINTAKWFKNCEEYWVKNRTDRNEKNEITSFDYLNWQNKLTEQNLNCDYLVLYTASATNANATVIKRKDFELEFFVESKAYWYGTNNIQEAYYLTAFLNAQEPNRIIKDFQSRGLFGPRDIHKKILEVPLPKYDPDKASHFKVYQQSKIIEQKVSEYLKDIDTTDISSREVGSLRTDILEFVDSEMSEINKLLIKIIENQ